MRKNFESKKKEYFYTKPKIKDQQTKDAREQIKDEKEYQQAVIADAKMRQKSNSLE